MRHLCLSILLCITAFQLFAQNSTRNYAVEVSAEVSENPASIKFTWRADSDANSYTVFRKPKTQTYWGFPVASLSGSDTTWTDTTVQVGEAWEYKFEKAGSGFFQAGAGYVYAGIKAPVIEHRGKLLLIIDTTYADTLATEIERFEMDLVGDGWTVVTHGVDAGDTPPSVRAFIQTEYNADPTEVKMVVLLGHVPVPYSGFIAPDAHIPDHQGAWPADVYYADVDGGWTDLSVNTTTPTRPENDNVPLDGKFDESVIPSNVDLMVGRIDLEDMTAFTLNEGELLRRYLNKDHAWRHKEFTAKNLGVVDDNFGVLGGQEAFASSAWRNFGPLIGHQNSSAGDYRTDMGGSDTYLWSYGCGGGSYVGASGIGTTTNFLSDTLNGVFTMIFGSYHGDWDSKNNFMRAALANKGTILTCAWAGRPHWFFHHMGLGEPIGYAAPLAQNNTNLYFGAFGSRQVHIALMGDPSLRLHPVGPPMNVAAVNVNNGRDNDITWTASTDSILGYYVYQAANEKGPYWRISNSIVTDTMFLDSCPLAGDNYYMVRALKLQEGPSGTYYNLSQGAFANVNNAGSISLTPSAPGVVCAGDTVTLDYMISGAQCKQGMAYIELSDSSGSFLAADTIGMAIDTGAGPITGVIPANAIPGINYLMRVAVQPNYTSADNGTAFEVMGLPVAAFSFTQNWAWGDTAYFSDSSSNASSYLWDFGDGTTDTVPNPTHVFPFAGNTTVTLTVTNACGSDSTSQVVNTISIEDLIHTDIKVWPNPNEGNFTIEGEFHGELFIRVFDISGRMLFEENTIAQDKIELDISGHPAGIYSVWVSGSNGIGVARFMKK